MEDSPETAPLITLKTWAVSASPKPRKKREVLASLSPITKEEWEALTPKAKWDSQVALRGPDLVNSQTVKTFTTSIIRHRLSGVMRVGGLVTDWLPFVVLPKPGWGDSPYTKKDPSRFPTFDWSHFVGHVTEASLWLSIPVAYVEESAWKSLMEKGSSRNPISVAVEMLPYLEGPYQDLMKSILVNRFGWRGEGTEPPVEDCQPEEAL